MTKRGTGPLGTGPLTPPPNATATEQSRLLEALLASSAALNSSLNLTEILDEIMSSLARVVPYDAANIMLVENGTTRTVATQGYSPEMDTWLRNAQYIIRETSSLRQIYSERKPLLISSIPQFSGWQKPPANNPALSFLGAPIITEGEIIGFINLDSQQEKGFSEHHADTLPIFAEQAAIAIWNAQVFEQAHSFAVAEERQRLARELHDAVSQSLFSASMMAESLPLMMKSKPQAVESGLLQLAKLTKGALAEMRTLLFELRPQTIQETDLHTLFTNLTNSFRPRMDAEIALVVEGEEFHIPGDVKANLYRIAQEAMNNIHKHAHASQVKLTLHNEPGNMLVTIVDNGRGFDRNIPTPGHMGLRIMQERAASSHIQLTIHSQPDEGTHVTAAWMQTRK